MNADVQRQVLSALLLDSLVPLSEAVAAALACTSMTASRSKAPVRYEHHQIAPRCLEQLGQFLAELLPSLAR